MGRAQKPIEQAGGKPWDVFPHMQVATGGSQRIPFAARAWPLVNPGGNTVTILEQNMSRCTPELPPLPPQSTPPYIVEMNAVRAQSRNWLSELHLRSAAQDREYRRPDSCSAKAPLQICELGQRHADDLIHVVIAVCGEAPPQETDVGQHCRHRCVLRIKLTRRRRGNRIVWLVSGAVVFRILANDGRVLAVLPRRVFDLDNAGEIVAVRIIHLHRRLPKTSAIRKSAHARRVPTAR